MAAQEWARLALAHTRTLLAPLAFTLHPQGASKGILLEENRCGGIMAMDLDESYSGVSSEVGARAGVLWRAHVAAAATCGSNAMLHGGDLAAEHTQLDMGDCKH